MSLAKSIQQKSGEDEGNEKAQRTKSLKKNVQQPPKVKKVEGAKKAPKKSDEVAAPIAWWNSARQYLREVAYELRKVVWPTRKETIGSTSVVLIIVLLSGVFLGVVDLILSRVIRLLVG